MLFVERLKMKIWQLSFDVENFDMVKPLYEYSVNVLQSFDGRSHTSDWTTLEVTKIEKSDLPMGDAHNFTFFPIVSKNALDILFPLISESVEILPVDFSGTVFYGLNVITVLDAIDYAKSEYKTFRDGKRIMAFQKYCFKSDVVKNVHIFKITDEKTRRAFVSEQFKRKVEETNLTGFCFKLVWDSNEN